MEHVTVIGVDLAKHGSHVEGAQVARPVVRNGLSPIRVRGRTPSRSISARPPGGRSGRAGHGSGRRPASPLIQNGTPTASERKRTKGPPVRAMPAK